MKTPIIYSNDSTGKPVPVFSQGDYDVFVGALEADKLPTYVVINRATNVVEFTTEVTGLYKEWLNYFVKEDLQPELPLSLSMSNRNN